ncbi:PDDEXK nuclease domain-containing protein [Raineya sp.]|jgi:predicted nuclease of restriction endonuclease-like (RecB) superfamily
MFPDEYKLWINELKAKIRSTQIKAAIAVNSVLIEFYWEIGKAISEKENVWGSKLIESVSKDLKAEFPNLKGFSKTNLKYCKRFYEFYTQAFSNATIRGIGQQTVDQFLTSITALDTIREVIFRIPWGHNIFIFTQVSEVEEALFYAQKTIENNWSREVLDLQIKSKLFQRQGKAIHNFQRTLPEPMSDLAHQAIKDPYVFDFISLTEKYQEKDIERQLIQHISRFLLELGKGFAFVGQQYHFQIADNDYYIDLLFYHIKLKCYVVIELKNTKFTPEFAGKLNFYLSAIDSILKEESDNPTIGILLCKSKNNIEVEFALRDIQKPIGVSEMKLVEHLPENLKSSLPTIEEFEQELKNI